MCCSLKGSWQPQDGPRIVDFMCFFVHGRQESDRISSENSLSAGINDTTSRFRRCDSTVTVSACIVDARKELLIDFNNHLKSTEKSNPLAMKMSQNVTVTH